jgi:integrase
MPANLYKRGRTWWGRVKVAGHDHRRSLRTSDRAEAQKRLSAWLKEISHAKFHGEARHTYKEMAHKWALEYLPRSVKLGTAQRYLVSSRQLDPYFRDLYIDEIDRKRVAKMVSERLKLGVTNATIRRDLTAMSSMFDCAVGWIWLEENPVKAYDRGLIKERRDPITPPSDESISEFVEKISDLANLAKLVLFLRQTGMREEEGASLEWPQIHEMRREATLLKTKTSRPRVVPLSDEAWGTLEGTERHPESRYVFWHSNGQRYQNVASRLLELKKRHGFTWRVHDLRHKYAIEWLRANPDKIYTLQKNLGHKSIKTTEIYLDYIGAQEGAQ